VALLGNADVALLGNADVALLGNADVALLGNADVALLGNADVAVTHSNRRIANANAVLQHLRLVDVAENDTNPRDAQQGAENNHRGHQQAPDNAQSPLYGPGGAVAICCIPQPAAAQQSSTSTTCSTIHE
jgi:hypothetical protein